MKRKIKNFTVIGMAICTLTIGGGLSASELSSSGDSSVQTTVNAPPQGSNKAMKIGKGMRKMDFSGLVSEGIIDQSTADKISAYMEEKNTEMKAEMDSLKDMTESERQAYFESKKAEQPADIWSEMVSAGIITQAEADAIKAATPQNMLKIKDEANLLPDENTNSTELKKISGKNRTGRPDDSFQREGQPTNKEAMNNTQSA